IWCKGFSEPNAGSDLASLTARGVIDGTDVVVTGVKMWTTDAQHADFQELLVRTDSTSRRHHGLTWLICDMRSPGIEIRPITTMLLDAHVNTVFYNEVRIPRANVVGEIGDGWSTALPTPPFERGTGFIGDQLELYERVQRAIGLAKQVRLEDGRLAIDHDDIAQRLASLKADTIAIRAMTLASIAEADRTGVPGPKSSLMKLMVTSTHKALGALVGDILGWEFLEFDGDRASHPWTYDFLWSWVYTIAGGTSEIQREITADRLLGLPRARGGQWRPLSSLRCRTRSPARRKSSTAGTRLTICFTWCRPPAYWLGSASSASKVRGLRESTTTSRSGRWTIPRTRSRSWLRCGEPIRCR